MLFFINLIEVTVSVPLCFIDTIRLWSGIETLGIPDLNEFIGPKLKDLVTLNFNNDPGIKGFLNNLKILTNPRGLSIQGSLSRFYNGSNLQHLNRKDIGYAIENIGEALSLDISEAKVTRLDVAGDILLKHDPQIYYQQLGSLPRYTRLEQPDGLNYRIGKRELVFYDKLKECRSRKEIIPPDLLDKNLLRIELRFKSRIAKQLNIPQLSANALSEEQLYLTLVKKWESQYKSVQKYRKLALEEEAVYNVKDFEKFLIATGISTLGGHRKVETMLIDAFHKNIIKSRTQLRRLIARLEIISNTEGLAKDDESITELNLAIEEYAEQLRMNL